MSDARKTTERGKTMSVKLTPAQAKEMLGPREDPAWFDLISLPVMGLKHRGEDAIAIVRGLQPNESVIVLRESNNASDPNAIMVRARSQDRQRAAHVGYVPGECAGWLARIMDNGHTLRAHVEYADAREQRLTITLRMRKASK